MTNEGAGQQPPGPHVQFPPQEADDVEAHRAGPPAVRAGKRQFDVGVRVGRGHRVGDRGQHLVGQATRRCGRAVGRYAANHLLPDRLRGVKPEIEVVPGCLATGDTFSERRGRSRNGFAVIDVPAERVVQRLADNGICAIANAQSRVLDLIGVDDIGGAVTVGLAHYSTTAEVDQLVRALASLG